MQQSSTTQPSCRFCESGELHETAGAVEYFGVSYSVLWCPLCRVAMTWPQPDIATLEHFYAPGEYRAEEGKRFVAPVEWLFELHKKHSFAKLAGGLSSGRMLDIGCGSGFTASLFAKNGWSVSGVEFSDETASHARETYHIDVVTAVSELRGTFDLILINHVLEHCFDPELLLHECKSLLSPTGRLVVAVPNFSSFQSSVGQKNWFHRDLPVHLFHFSEAGLEKLLGKSGYAIIGRSHADLAQNFYGWLQTLLNCAGLQHNALYDFIRMRAKDSAGLSMAVFLSLLNCVWAIPAALLGMCAEKVFRTGGVIRFTAVGNQVKPLREDLFRAE